MTQTPAASQTLMKITRLIEKLQEAKANHGDVDVCFPDMAEGGHINIDSVVPKYPWKAGQMCAEDKDA
jgi:hypothetical protein